LFRESESADIWCGKSQAREIVASPNRLPIKPIPKINHHARPGLRSVSGFRFCCTDK
jgi:hypothetical protein